MTGTTKATQKTTGRKTPAKPNRETAARKSANNVGAAKPPRTAPRRRKPSPAPSSGATQSAAGTLSAAGPGTAVRPEAGAAPAPDLPRALTALIGNREALIRASAEFGNRMAGLAQAQWAAQIEAAQGLAGAADPARAAEIHRTFLSGTAVRAAEAAAGWRAAMAVWLDGAAALWGGSNPGGIARKEDR